MLLGRTAVNLGSLAAMPRSWLRASIRACMAEAAPVQQLKVEPLGMPSSMTAGGGKAKTMALRIAGKGPMALPAMALAFRSARSRSFQSFSLMNTMPLFCARPEKPMPAMVMQDSTASFSFS